MGDTRIARLAGVLREVARGSLAGLGVIAVVVLGALHMAAEIGRLYARV